MGKIAKDNIKLEEILVEKASDETEGLNDEMDLGLASDNDAETDDNNSGDGSIKNIEELNEVMPLIPMRGLALLPSMVLHFDVEREKSINALEEAMVKNQRIFLTAQKDTNIDLPMENDFYTIGTIAKIKQILKLPGDVIRVLVEGVERGKIVELVSDTPYFKAKIKRLVDNSNTEVDPKLEALRRAIIEKFDEYAFLHEHLPKDLIASIIDITSYGVFADAVGSHLDVPVAEKQKIVEALDLEDRLVVISELLRVEVEILRIREEISAKVKGQMNQNQKEYYLREQLKAIKEELGIDDSEDPDGEEILSKREALKKLKLDKKTTEKIDKEITRLSKMNPSTAEAALIRNYVETILELPWKKQTTNKNTIIRSEEILDEDHYGLKKVKERILEYLAVIELSKGLKGPILCLVGPPGTGKTSIAKSIARATSRDFVRMSLGGVRDEAEIRGHRRTYVGAIPGRVINSIKEAGSKNPVFLLDEIDKIGADFKGDPASALLEVLDPEQNKDFMDHYLEVPFDLSKAMFITTANSLDTIPRPLLDRMEVIEVTSYTEEEKLHIAKNYLIPKKIKEHGLKEENVSVSSKAISDIINYYTRESGVRNLEREVANLCRKIARRTLAENKEMFQITNRNLEGYLGKKRYRYDIIKGKSEVGITTGLAWTAVGGDTLFIEVVTIEGKGKLVLTGMMGEVMQESAQAALNYIRSNAKEFGLAADFYDSKEIHIHIPEGAIPKDGPSAGVTMSLALISALTGKPAKQDIAMTGEINLRGQVLPVGGIREKVMAAHRAGIRKVLLPWENEKDIDEIPVKVRKEIEFVLLERIENAAKIVIEGF